MNVSGAQRRPIMKEREKLRVARVERKRPRRRKEKDLMRRYCWVGFTVAEVDEEEEEEEEELRRLNRAARDKGSRRSAKMET